MTDAAIPVGLDCTAGGELTLSAEAFNLPVNCKVTLEDILNGVVVPDFDKRPYVVRIDANSILSRRFIVKMATTTVLSEVDPIRNNLSVYSIKNREITINGLIRQHSIASLFDIQGRLVLSQMLEEGSQNSILLPEISDGIYILLVKDNDRHLSFKLAVRK
jgi:hypothetical protein